jgi:type IV secretion system protein VirB8
MKNLQKDITESIKSGEYFKDAREWYILKYVYPVTQRAFLIFITGLSVIFAIVAIKIFLTFLPLVEVVPIAVDVKSKVDQYVRLKPIGKSKEDPNESLIKYLVMRYIEARESYDYKAQKEGYKLKYLKDFSSRTVFNEYKSEISFDNAESPILLYKKHTRRIIEPLEVNVLNKKLKIETGIQKVTAKFRAYEVGRKGIKSSLWLAKMKIEYETAEYSREVKKFSPLHFKINFYEVSKLSDE